MSCHVTSRRGALVNPHDHLESESLVSEEEESEDEEEESELELEALRRAGMECGSALTLAFSAVDEKQFTYSLSMLKDFNLYERITALPAYKPKTTHPC